MESDAASLLVKTSTDLPHDTTKKSAVYLCIGLNVACLQDECVCVCVC